MAVTGPITGFKATDPNTGLSQDLGNRYVSKDYLLSVYPNIASQLGARTSPGILSCGYGSKGQLADGTTVSKSSPVQVGSLTNWKQVSTGGHWQTTMVKTDGTLWGCGYNTTGCLGDGTTTQRSSPVQVGLLTNWKQVAAGGKHSAAVKTDGTLWTYGANAQGQLGDNTATGNSSPNQTIAAGTNWKQVACGYFHTLAVKTDGTLWTWGYNLFGQLGNTSTATTSSPAQLPSPLTNWSQVSGGRSHSAAVKTDGTLWTWGSNAAGQLGDGTGVAKSSPVQTVAAGTSWKQVACGYAHTAAVKTDGTLWTWGNNPFGQLGYGTGTTFTSSPAQVGSLTNWKQVAAGRDFTAAIKTDGTLWTFGDDTLGQLGNGANTTNISSPIQVGSLTTWKQVGVSYTSFMAIADGYI
jgi:alpha-tubulin suppressor-like RCC1 family protein